MKNSLLKKGVSLILCLLMIVSALASCNSEEEAPSTDTTAPETSGNKDDKGGDDESKIESIISSDEYKMVVTEGASDYVIIYPAGNETMKAVAEALKEKLQADTDAVLEVKDDTAAAVEKEILVGNTNRTEDDGAYGKIKYSDYAVEAVGSKIVIAAYEQQCLEMAWKRAVIALNITEENGKMFAYFKNDYSYFRSGEYAPEELTVNGNSINKYVIVYGDDLDLAISEYIQLIIATACGEVLPIKKSTNASEAADYEILVGHSTGRTVADITTENDYVVKTVDNTVVFYYKNTRAGRLGAEQYEAKLEELIGENKDAKSIEIKSIENSGSAKDVVIGQILYSENFDSKEVNTDTASTLSALGWKTVYKNKYGTGAVEEFANIIKQGDGDNAVQLDGGWTRYDAVSASTVRGIEKYTIQMDISFDASATNFYNFSIMFGGCVEDTNDKTADAASYGIQIRNFPSADATGPSGNDNTTVKYLCGYKFVNGANNKRFNTGLMLGDVNKIVIEIDTAANTVTLSIYPDGSDTAALTVTYDDFTVESSGLHFKSQVAKATIDNIVVSVGTYADYKATLN